VEILSHPFGQFSLHSAKVNRYMELPQLGKVPSVVGYPLRIKATASGITVLKENNFRRRYTGNKFSAVDINGGLWIRASELEKHVREGVDKKPKKKARVETPAAEKKLIDMQISGNLSTLQMPDRVDSPKLSTKKERQYSVHKREVRQRLLGFMNTQRGKKELYFWTVTFPKGTADDIAYKMYNIWLTALRQYRMLKAYLWVAERQENGTIHFHIAIPHKMPVQRANAMMRGTLKTFSRRGEVPYTVYQCNRYNGVDIAKNRATKRVTNFAIKKGARALVTYLTKYVTKNDGTFKHLAWHNSREFSSIFTGVTFTVPEFTNNGWHLLIDRRKQLSCEYFTFVPWINDPPPEFTEHLYILNSYIQNILNPLS
jgi:hypothetical protein